MSQNPLDDDSMLIVFVFCSVLSFLFCGYVLWSFTNSPEKREPPAALMLSKTIADWIFAFLCYLMILLPNDKVLIHERTHTNWSSTDACKVLGAAAMLCFIASQGYLTGICWDLRLTLLNPFRKPHTESWKLHVLVWAISIGMIAIVWGVDAFQYRTGYYVCIACDTGENWNFYLGFLMGVPLVAGNLSGLYVTLHVNLRLRQGLSRTFELRKHIIRRQAVLVACYTGITLIGSISWAVGTYTSSENSQNGKDYYWNECLKNEDLRQNDKVTPYVFMFLVWIQPFADAMAWYLVSRYLVKYKAQTKGLNGSKGDGSKALLDKEDEADPKKRKTQNLSNALRNEIVAYMTEGLIQSVRNTALETWHQYHSAAGRPSNAHHHEMEDIDEMDEMDELRNEDLRRQEALDQFFQQGGTEEDIIECEEVVPQDVLYPENLELNTSVQQGTINQFEVDLGRHRSHISSIIRSQHRLRTSQTHTMQYSASVEHMDIPPMDFRITSHDSDAARLAPGNTLNDEDKVNLDIGDLDASNAAADDGAIFEPPPRVSLANQHSRTPSTHLSSNMNIGNLDNGNDGDDVGTNEPTPEAPDPSDAKEAQEANELATSRMDDLDARHKKRSHSEGLNKQDIASLGKSPNAMKVTKSLTSQSMQRTGAGGAVHYSMGPAVRASQMPGYQMGGAGGAHGAYLQTSTSRGVGWITSVLNVMTQHGSSLFGDKTMAPSRPLSRNVSADHEKSVTGTALTHGLDAVPQTKVGNNGSKATVTPLQGPKPLVPGRSDQSNYSNYEEFKLAETIGMDRLDVGDVEMGGAASGSASGRNLTGHGSAPSGNYAHYAGYDEEATKTKTREETDYNIFQKWPFKDYGPHVFRYLRQKVYKISDSEYLKSIQLKSQDRVNQKFSEGRSGAFFFFSQDSKYIIKTIPKSEASFLLHILKRFVEYLRKNPKSRICRIFGLHSLEMYNLTLYFVVMENVFVPNSEPQEKYDIKGSWIDRHTNHHVESGKLMKDEDLHKTLKLMPEDAEAIFKQLKKDTRFLMTCNIMDYSLLLGIYYFGVDPEHVSRRKRELLGPNSTGALRAAEPELDAEHAPTYSPPDIKDRDDRDERDNGREQDILDAVNTGLSASNSKHDNSALAGGDDEDGFESGRPSVEMSIRNDDMTGPSARGSAVSARGGTSARGSKMSARRRTKDDAGGAGTGADAKRLDSSVLSYPSDLQTIRSMPDDDFLKHAFRQPAPSYHEGMDRVGRNEKAIKARVIEGPGIYYVGIIDMLQEWNSTKKMESFLKVYFRCKNRNGISCVEPRYYRKRFLRKMFRIGIRSYQDYDDE